MLNCSFTNRLRMMLSVSIWKNGYFLILFKLSNFLFFFIFGNLISKVCQGNTFDLDVVLLTVLCFTVEVKSRVLITELFLDLCKNRQLFNEIFLKRNCPKSISKIWIYSNDPISIIDKINRVFWLGSRRVDFWEENLFLRNNMPTATESRTMTESAFLLRILNFNISQVWTFDQFRRPSNDNSFEQFLLPKK